MTDLDMSSLFGQQKNAPKDARTLPPPPGGLSGSFFGPKKPVVNPLDSEIVHQINDLSDRVRILEERYTNMRSKAQLTDQTILSNQKKAMEEIKTINSEIMELRRAQDELKSTIKLIIKELQECMKKEDFLVLKKYIELWEPLNFVTRNELDKTLNSIHGTSKQNQTEP